MKVIKELENSLIIGYSVVDDFRSLGDSILIRYFSKNNENIKTLCLSPAENPSMFSGTKGRVKDVFEYQIYEVECAENKIFFYNIFGDVVSFNFKPGHNEKRSEIISKEIQELKNAIVFKCSVIRTSDHENGSINQVHDHLLLKYYHESDRKLKSMKIHTLKSPSICLNSNNGIGEISGCQLKKVMVYDNNIALESIHGDELLYYFSPLKQQTR